ncbi:PALP domain-containing protein [Citrus sinensis]|nr:PALP domain-containing protein [Citrus sinensis]
MLLCSSCSGNLLSSIVSPKLRQRLIRVSESQLHHHQQHKIKMERKESGNDSDAFGFKFLTKTPYASPSWASHLTPIPSHVFSLGHRDDLSGMQLSGNKVRKLEFLMADAVAQGADCIITIGGIQSNHCRAAAVAAKYLNLDCYLILRTSKVLVDQDPGLTGNLLVERLVGAHIELISKEEYSKIGSVTLTNILKEKLLKEGRRPYVIPVGGSNSIGTWGYIEAIKEIEQQLQTGTGGVKFDDIVVACGSGGTIAGLSLGSWLGTLKAKVGSLKSTIDERFNTVQQQFSSLEVMLLKLTELHLNPPLATSTGHDGVSGEGFDGTEPVVGGDAEGGGPKTTNLAQLGVMGHGRFGGGVVGPGDSWPRGAFPGVGQGRGSWVTAGGGGVFGERGSGYDRNVAGQGISTQYRARQGEFWAGSSGYAETGVDSGGWRPPMGRALFRLQWTLRKGKTDGSDIIFGGKGPCVVSMARTMTTIEVHAFSVCDDPDYFYDYTQGLLDGLNAGVDSHDIVNIQNSKGLGYAINTSEELNFVKDIAAATGVVLDPVYSGKAAYGMLNDMAQNPKKWEGRKVLFVHTGGLLGLFDKVDQMAPRVKNWSRMDVHESVPRKDGTGKMF